MAKNNRTRDSEGRKAAATGLGALILAAPACVLGGSEQGAGMEWVRSFLIAVGLALAIRWVLTEPFRIPSGSMEPTLHGDARMFHGDRVFVNKWVYGTRWPLNKARIPLTNIHIRYADRRLWSKAGPQRWDIVVFKTVEENAEHTTLVKRVVGLPGERIHVADGKVHVNGKPLELPPSMPQVYYKSPESSFSDMKYGILTDNAHAVVPEGCYLLLGDNSAHSRDGRYFGWVPNENILGRVSCIWWPYSRWRDFTGFSRTWWWRTLVTIAGALLFARIFVGRSWGLRWQTTEGKLKVDHVYVNRWAFGIPIPFTHFRLFKARDPRRGELVFYRRPDAKKGEPGLLLGRVAGLPGERVYLDAGKLSIDGVPIKEPASLANREFASAEGVGPYARSKGKEYSLVPEGHFFILTESNIPEEHYDSRTVGWAPHKSLIGCASAVWWPPTRWRRIR